MVSQPIRAHNNNIRAHNNNKDWVRGRYVVRLTLIVCTLISNIRCCFHLIRIRIVFDDIDDDRSSEADV